MAERDALRRPMCGLGSTLVAVAALSLVACGHETSLPPADPDAAVRRTDASTTTESADDEEVTVASAGPTTAAVTDAHTDTGGGGGDRETTGTDTGDRDRAGDTTIAAAVEMEPLTVGAEWVDITANLVGTESTCGNISGVVALSQRDDVVVGVSGNGLFTYDEAATTWNALGTGADSTPIDNRLMHVLEDPDDPNRFWESGSYGTGVFRTTDAGTTFERLGDIDQLDFVSVDFTDPARATMLVGAHERTALYHSTDAGETWEDIATNLPPGVGHASSPLVIDTTTFLLGTYSGDGAGIFRSTDAGATWTQVADTAVIGVPLVDGETIHWLAQGGGGLMVSRDGGQTFTAAGGNTGGRGWGIARIGDGAIAAVGDRGVVVTYDGGQRWQEIGPPLPIQPFSLTYSDSRDALYAWRFTCNFGPEGNPVLPDSIVRLDVVPPS